MLRRIWLAWWKDENGWTSPEWAFVATILVLGAITGALVSKQTHFTTQAETQQVRE